MGLVRLEKASNVARYFLITIIHKSTKTYWCLLDLCTTIFQKLMAAIFQDGGHFQHENHFLDSFLQTCAILMSVLSNHTFLTMQNQNFDLRNSVKAYLTKYKTKS